MAQHRELGIGLASDPTASDLDLETASTATAALTSGRESLSRTREQDGLLRGGKKVFGDPQCPYILTTVYIYTGLIVVAWLVSLLLMGHYARTFSAPHRHSYETGFETDFKPLRSFIALKKVEFTGGLKFDENGTTYRAVDHSMTQYVGEPSPRLDRAWHELIRGQFVDLRGEEAETVADITYLKPGGWHATGPDAFHQLHCLNLLRQSLRPDYYTPVNPEPVHTMHVDHCLDYLRQGVMCASDLTPTPLRWSETRNREYQDTETIHTCRDFDKIHEWTLARDAGAHPDYYW